MPEPMPEIEVGDWFEYRTRPGTALSKWSVYQAVYPLSREWSEAIIEIRKPDGRVWRREEPTP
jgi:hypothetical protein